METLAAVKQVFRAVLFLGFIAAIVFTINFEFRAFKSFFGERTLRYWWLFLFLTVVPFLIFIHFFAVFFLS